MIYNTGDFSSPIENNTEKGRFVYGATDIGRSRNHNEDAFYFNKNIFVVADGMGGYNAGEVASRHTIAHIQKRLTPDKLNQLQELNNHLLSDILQSAHRDILKLSRNNSEYRGMGCTIVIACLWDQQCHVCHVGDSRAYHINKKEIYQIGTDHSHVAEAVLAGKMGKEEARQSDMKNFVTQAIGGNSEIIPEYLTTEVSPNDRIVLCSDGLWEMISDDKIKNIALSCNDARVITETLIREANTAGGFDNITVITVIIPSNQE